MDVRELRKQDVKELIELREKTVRELTDAYFDMRTGKLKNVRKPLKMRRERAMLETVLHEKGNQPVPDVAEAKTTIKSDKKVVTHG